MQEIEKKKYEKYIEKKKQRKLKKEREEIERTQQQRSEEARLAMPLSSGGNLQFKHRFYLGSTVAQW